MNGILFEKTDRQANKYGGNQQGGRQALDEGGKVQNIRQDDPQADNRPQDGVEGLHGSWREIEKDPCSPVKEECPRQGCCLVDEECDREGKEGGQADVENGNQDVQHPGKGPETQVGTPILQRKISKDEGDDKGTGD